MESVSSRSLFKFFWIRCQSSIVRKCSRQFLEPKPEDGENLILMVLFRTTRINVAQFADHRFRIVAG